MRGTGKISQSVSQSEVKDYPFCDAYKNKMQCFCLHITECCIFVLYE